MSLFETVEAILAEAARLEVVYRRARRRRLGWKKGQRPGPLPSEETFILEARSRVLNGLNLSSPERAEVDVMLRKKRSKNKRLLRLLALTGSERSRKFDRWRSSYPYKQMCWRENFENHREAQRIGRLIVRAGTLSAAAIRRDRGLSKWRLDDLTPLVLGLNPSLELQVRGKGRVFRTLPKGSPELAARVAEWNRRVEEEARRGLEVWAVEWNRRVTEQESGAR